MKKLHSFLLFFGLSFLGTAQLTIIVDEIPENTPEEDPIHIAGNFQGWDPGSVNHQLIKDTIANIHHITLPAGLGDLEFKFTRGAWEKVESDENGNFIPNRFYAPTDGDTIYLQILGWEDLDGNGGGQSTAAENVSILSDSFYMPELDRYRRVWIYLPPDYETSGLDYPVLYMHDGQNCFDALTSFVGEWEVDETLNALHAEGDTGIIVVAIDNGGAFRTEEYTPWSHPTYGGGNGNAYVDFIVNSLKPFIDTNYRTLPNRENTGIMGSSLGGLISTYAGIQHQAVFGKIGSFSPSYWWSTEAYNHVTETGKETDLRIFQLMGTLEGEDNVARMFAMEDTLHQAGFLENEVLSVEKTDGQHSEWFWAREFEDAYIWLFRNQTTSTHSSDQIIRGVHLFPNPVQENATLSFYLKKSGTVEIELIDSAGTLSRKLYTNALTTGEHLLEFDLQKLGLPAGIYFLRLKSGLEISSIKFVLAPK